LPPDTRSLKPFLILWSGQAASLFGSQLVQFALIWWLTTTTGSATTLALASLSGLLPQVVLGPFVGVLVDRWNRRMTMLLADGLVAVATFGLALLFWAGAAQTWHVFAILFIRALGGAFHWPAMQSSTTLMVPKEFLTRIQGFNQMLYGGLNIASAPLGALLLGVFPLQGILFIDLATAVIAMSSLLVIHVPQPERAPSTSAATFYSEFGADLRAGLRYVWSWPALMLLMLIAVILNLVINPAFALLPLLVTGHFGGQALHLGVLEGIFGFGILTGGLLLSVWGGFQRRILTSLVALIGMGVGTLLMGLAPANMLWLAFVAAFIIGSTNSLVNGPVQAIFQATVEPEMQGRVFTLLGSAAGAMSPIGLIIAGPVADWLGVRAWFLFGGSVTLLMGIGCCFLPVLLRIEDGRKTQLATE
ncbi:MAG: MFS transporter, partial [Chloroflexi bacterium]|nr:MFS transporter [Chloroflexota bacterium]